MATFSTGMVSEATVSASPDEVWAAAGELFSYALTLGGTLSGEHGIGILKRRWLGDELGCEQLELQRQIKAVFDPHNVLNPGKIFEPSPELASVPTPDPC